MTSRRYVLAIALMVLSLVGPFIAYNLLVDDFGLFWSSAPKRIWTLEKTSKYLMSFRYIPQHFDGLLVGPSYSDGLMDTRAINGFRVYNLSMDGGDATELRIATVNALQRGHFRLLIICLSPYITKDSGIKGSQINSKEYWGSIFSLLPLEVMEAKWLAHEHPDRDMLRGTEWGEANIARPVFKWADFVRSEINDPLEKEVHIDPRAYQDLAAIIQTAHQRGVRVLGYFYPNSIWRSETAVDDGDWARYETQVRALLRNPGDVVWDMMGPEYQPIRADAGCFTDGHLSVAGARLVLADINREVGAQVEGLPEPPTLPVRKPLACSGLPGAGSGFDRTL